MTLHITIILLLFDFNLKKRYIDNNYYYRSVVLRYASSIQHHNYSIIFKII